MATARAEEEEKQESNTTMETPTSKKPNINSKTPPWTFETNWIISQGSLEVSVAVESSDFPIAESVSESLGPTSKPPLVLKPSRSQSGPCEIKISFSQKYEIQQVYVRSTSRVYEIHYASTPQCEDEYLCTVRCSITALEEDLLHASDFRETVCANSEWFGGEAAQVKMVGGSSSGTSEDDWVEVKCPNVLPDNRNKYLPEQLISKTGSFQDFYEATAEISDVDPCISITLRLLSLQCKGCVYVDEVYMFAEPLKSVGSEYQVNHAENSAGSSLMAMLVPTLLQLSKSGVGRVEDHALGSKEKQEHLEIESRASSTADSASGIQQAEQCNATGWQNVKLHASQLEENMRLQETYRAIPEPNHLQAHAAALHGEKSDPTSKNVHHSCIQVERVLEQLVSRVSRIEDLCLRFEENMLKPINSIVERLQRVEQQVEVLAKNSLSAGLPSGTRFSAPAFSSNESNSSSFYNDGNSSQPCGAFELETKDTTSSKPDDQQFLPSLVMTAPEFSCCDDEEENDVSAPPKISPQRKPKKAISIDDALAAALAGFSSMTCAQSSIDKEYFKAATSKSASKYNVAEEPSECIETPVAKLSGVTNDDEPTKLTQTLKVRAPEFTVEENGNEDIVSALSSQKGKSVVPSGICAIGKTNCVSDSMSTSASAAVIESVQSLGNVEGICEVECPFLPKDEYHCTEGVGELENSNLMSRVSISENADILKQFDAYQTRNGSDATQFGASARTRDFEDQSDGEISSNVPSSSYVSMVDFNIPILEVKFAARDIFSAKSTLEALLTDKGEISVQPPAQENDDIISQEIDVDFGGNGEAMNLSVENNLLVELDGCSGDISLDSVENGETMSSAAKDHQLVELDGNGVEEVHVEMASAGMQDHLTSFNQEIIASLI